MNYQTSEKKHVDYDAAKALYTHTMEFKYLFHLFATVAETVAGTDDNSSASEFESASDFEKSVIIGSACELMELLENKLLETLELKRSIKIYDVNVKNRAMDILTKHIETLLTEINIIRKIIRDSENTLTED